MIGSAVAAVGLYLWANKVLGLNVNSQWYFIMLAGFGMGLMVGPANTDAINQVGRLSYGEATGVTQTTRNFGASVGLAALGTLLVTQIHNRLTDDLVNSGLAQQKAEQIAGRASQSNLGASSSASLHTTTQAATRAVHDAVASGMRSVLLAMAIVMAVAAVVALVGLRRGIHHAADVGADDEVAVGLDRGRGVATPEAGPSG